jgi:hypothetical protein
LGKTCSRRCDAWEALIRRRGAAAIVPVAESGRLSLHGFTSWAGRSGHSPLVGVRAPLSHTAYSSISRSGQRSGSPRDRAKQQTACVPSYSGGTPCAASIWLSRRYRSRFSPDRHGSGPATDGPQIKSERVSSDLRHQADLSWQRRIADLNLAGRPQQNHHRKPDKLEVQPRLELAKSSDRAVLRENTRACATRNAQV